MKTFLIVVIVCLAVLPLVFATPQPTVGLSYDGPYPLRPCYVIGTPNELTAQFKVGNSGTEPGILALAVSNVTADFRAMISANDFQLAPGEQRDLTLLFIVTNPTNMTYDLVLMILMSQANLPQNVSGIGRASFRVPISLTTNTTGTPIPEFDPLILAPFVILLVVLVLRRRRNPPTAAQFIRGLRRNSMTRRRLLLVRSISDK